MFLKFIDTKGKEHNINPFQIADMEPGQKKGDPENNKPGDKYTVLHMNSVSMPKIIVKESPDELKKIFAKFEKRKFTVTEE